MHVCVFLCFIFSICLIWYEENKKKKNFRTFRFPPPSGDDAARAFNFFDLSRMGHAGDVDVGASARGSHETQQGDIIGQRQIVELWMNHDVADVQFFVRQLLRRYADVVLAQTNFQQRADVLARYAG